MFDHQDILFAEKYLKNSIRNAKWDYSSPAIYFITFCTFKHNNHFGEIIDNNIVLNDIGKIVSDEVLNTFKIRKYLKLHDYVIMPNHVHLLLEILPMVETPHRGVSNILKDISMISKDNNFHKPEIASERWKPNSIGSIINQIKSISTKRINKIPRLFGWQSGYYDEIIKDEKHYWKVKEYIQNNVRNWENDENKI